MFPDCDKGAEPAGHDHRPVAQLSRNLDGHHPDERGPRHLLALVGLRDLQQHQKRQGRRPQAAGESLKLPRDDGISSEISIESSRKIWN